MYAFEFHRPGSLDAATAALEAAADGKLLAGGHSLLPMMKQRLASFSDLIDLSAVPDLDGIRAGDGELVIGAMATHASVAASAAVRASIPALAELARGSVVERHLRCGQPTCACHQPGARGHGPYYYLVRTVGPGKTRSQLLAPSQVAQVRRWTENAKQLRQALEQITEIGRAHV